MRETTPVNLPKNNLFIIGGFVAAFAILIAVTLVSLHTIRDFADGSRWVTHTQTVLGELEELLSLVKDAENGQRGFLVTGDEQYLGLYEIAIDTAPIRLAELRRLVGDNSAQQTSLVGLESLIRELFATLKDGIGLKQENATEAKTLEALSRSTSRMNRLRAQIGQMRAEEYSRLRERSARSEYDATLTNQVIVVANLAALTLLTIAGWLLFREIRKRTQAEQALRNSNVFLNSLIENIPNMIFVKDAKDLRFVRFNKAGEELLGYAKEDLIGKNDYDFFPKEEAEFFTAKDRAVLSNGQLVDIPEEPIHTKHRGVRILHTMKIPVVKEDGTAQYLLGISEDITARKEAEQEIKRLHQSVMERAAQLEVSNRELEGFSYSVSHDLRAPLRAIDGFARMLQEDYAAQFDNQGSRWLSVIRDNSNKMGHLIDDLLAFSRIGRKPMEAAEFDMTALVQEVLNDLGETTKVSVSSLGNACADRALIKQVWVNLLSNALKYTGTRKNAIVEVFRRESDGEVYYGITDNGVGFDMRYYNKLFGVFERLHSADEFAGTGVGLAIVQRIIVRHGGRVWAEGKVDEGATFYFTLRTGEGNARGRTD